MGDFRKQAKLTFPLKKKESSEFNPIFIVHITSDSLENIIHAGSKVHPLVIPFQEKNKQNLLLILLALRLIYTQSYR